MTFYYCKECKWVEETPKVPKRCSRCTSPRIRELPVDEVMTLLDAGTIAACDACEIIHTR